jgi:hypothetical protein
MAVEQIPEPDDVAWAKAGPSAPPPRRLPGFTFLAWLAVIVAAAIIAALSRRGW